MLDHTDHWMQETASHSTHSDRAGCDAAVTTSRCLGRARFSHGLCARKVVPLLLSDSDCCGALTNKSLLYSRLILLPCGW